MTAEQIQGHTADLTILDEAAATLRLDAEGAPTGLSDTDLDALKVAATEYAETVAENEEFRVVPNRSAKRRQFYGFDTVKLNRSRIRRSRHRIRKQKLA